MPAKGSDFEREICKALSTWWTEGERDDVFWRSSQSGGRATQRAKSGKKTAGSYGDVAATDPCGAVLLDRMCIEIKRGYGTWSVQDVLDKGPRAAKQPFELFWEQARTSAAMVGPLCAPAVIFKKDKRRVCVALPASLIASFKIALACTYLVLRGGDMGAVVILALDDFFACVSPRKFKAPSTMSSASLVRRRTTPGKSS